MFKQLIFLAAFLAALFINAQSDFKFIPSGTYMTKGYSLLLNENYNESIDFFKQVHRSDTNYDAAQFNIVIAQFDSEQFLDLEKTALSAIQDENEYSSKIYYLYIESLIKLKDYKEANEVIAKGKKAFPLYFQYEYLSAKILIDQKKIKAAIETLHFILNIHPQHSESHYQLAKIKADQGYITEAILGFEMAIISNRSSSVLNESYVAMEDLMNNNYAVINKHKGKNVFKTLDQMIESKIALKENYQSSLGLNYMVARQTDLLAKQFAYKDETGSFGMNYYGRFFDMVIKNNLERGYILYVLSILNSPEIEKSIKKHSAQITEFENFLKNYWHEYQNKIKYPIKGETYVGDYNYSNSGILYGIGKIENDVNSGDWVFFYTNGNIKSKLSYNIKGELHGDCVWYDVYGNIFQQGTYENDKINGSATFSRNNNCKWYSGSFEDNEIEGELKLYANDGILLETKSLKNNRLNGAWKEYSKSGIVISECAYKSGKFDGLYRTYYNNGSLNEEYSYYLGKIEGDYRSYHLNGELANKGQYKNGIQVGQWTDYHYNGKVKGAYFYDQEGLAQKWHIKYSLNGDTISKTPYKNGKINGVKTDYYKDGSVLWEHLYKKGKLKKYTNYSKSGAVNSFGKKEYNLSDMFGFKYISATLKKGRFHGEHKTYYKSGRLLKLRNYSKGILIGEYKDYYESGKLETRCFLKNGLYHGKFESYHSSGQLYAVGYYNEGDKIGEWKYYSPNGKISQSEYFTNGVISGILTEYNLDGEKEYETKYNDQVVVRTDVFDKEGNLIKRYSTPQGNGDYSLLYTNGTVKMNGKLNGGRQNGEIVYMYPNGKIEESRVRINGVYHGVQTVYHSNGKVRRTGEFKQGFKEGKWVAYHYNGNKYWEADYTHDVIRDSITYFHTSGKIEKRIYYNIEGDILNRVDYHENGEIMSKTPYEFDLIHGEVNSYDETGTLMVSKRYNGGQIYEYSFNKEGKLLPYTSFNGTGKIEAKYDNGNKSAEFNLKDGLYEGVYVRYFSNGKTWIATNYFEDEIDGKYSEYYSNGILKTEGDYTLGELNGKYFTYHNNGQVESETTYVFDEKHGVAKYFTREGKLISTITYNENVVIDIK